MPPTPAELSVDVTVHCPFCQFTRYTVYRREVPRDNVISCLCRCQRCDETFTFIVDALGRPARG